jgi:predicted CXXCH cytochrome family protein
VRLAVVTLAIALPAAALATGGHDTIGCAGCHSMHAARGEAIFAVGPNTSLLDPRTGKPNMALSALCLSCHADPEDGGRGTASVSGHFHHPFSVEKPNPRLAQVPPELLREGRFECVGCHDPHPSNPNYRYLRIAAAGSPTLAELCRTCHPRKAEPAARTGLFSSMDERAARTAEPVTPAAPAPVAAPPRVR